MNFRKAERRLRKVAKDNGILVRRFTNVNALPKRQTYTGRTIQLVRESNAEFLMDLAHELGHYLVAPEEFRDARDFGWGSSYELQYEGEKPARKYDSSEEERASLLGIWMIKEVLGDDAASEVLVEHDWQVETHPHKVLTVTNELMRDGLIMFKDNRIVPTCLAA